MPNLGPMELLLILAVALLLFGGSRLAGVGKGTGRAIREFKEETKGLREADKAKSAPAAQPDQAQQPVQPQQYQQAPNPAIQQQPYVQQTPAGQYDQAVDAEIVDRPNSN